MLTVPTKVIRSQNRPNEKRTALFAGSGGGAGLVQTNVVDFIDALYDKNVLVGLGAQTLSGLVGNLSIPKSGGGSAAWEGEVEENADGTTTVTNIPASPKRLGAYGLVSKSLLMQAGNYDVEKIIQNDIINAINEKLQVAGISGAGSGSDQPTGILNTVGIGDVIGGATGAAPTQAHIIELEEKVATAKADIGTLAFLTNPKVRAKMKKTPLDAGSGMMLWDLKAYNELMGYNAGVTTAVPSDLTKSSGSSLSAIIFGNFADMMILQWGGFDIVLNPYTLAKTNQLEIVINSFWDIIIRRAASFAAMKDASTT
jgi:HK97 family phage major capsid protein